MGFDLYCYIRKEINMYIIFYLFWVVMNGKITLEIMLIGLFVAALLYLFICKFMGWSIRKDINAIRYIGFGICYAVVLIVEIIKANIATIGMIYTAKSERVPVLIRFDTDLQSELARVILANSITLTPGTITVEVDNNHFVVHALDESFAEGISESIFVKLLRKAERIGK